LIAADIAAESGPKTWNGYTMQEKCYACKVALVDGSKLCKGCLFVAYCSEKCAREKWPEHSDDCEFVRSAKHERVHAMAAGQKAGRAVEFVWARRDFPADEALAVKVLTAFAVRIEAQAAIDAGAPAAIVAAMTKHKDVADVAHYGCWALLNIAGIPAGQESAVIAGAPAAIVAAMTKHKNVADVAHDGIYALRNIACIPAGREAVVHAGAPRAIIAALHTHADRADVAQQGCGALWNIAILPSGIAAIIAAGGRAAIDSAVACHASAKEFGTGALNALRG
jgi:hypothetical protein